MTQDDEEKRPRPDPKALASEPTRAPVDEEAETVAELPPAESASLTGDEGELVDDPTRADPLDDGSNEGGPGEEAREELAATRVIDSRGKTAPPPSGVGATPSSPSAARPPTPTPTPPTPLDASRGLTPGTVLFGEYEIVNVLGVGGMGEVYRARHRRLEEHRAIKVMHAELSKKKGASEFFYREAKALLAVRHPAVVHCHDLLSDDEGHVYLIMEMIEGVPLSKKMNDGPLSPDEVAVLGARVSHGLAAAHRKGVIHRDVSPDNIVLPNGRVQEAKVIDFGIAKLLEDGEGTIVDGFKGKLSYASPEQLGFFAGRIDGRSDFYSLGLVLAAAALGRPMSMGTTVVEAVDARRNLEALPDAIPVGLRSAIQPLLALDPDDRPKFVDRLFVAPGGTAGLAEPGRISTGGRAAEGKGARQSGRKLVSLAAGGTLGALILGGGIYFAKDVGLYGSGEESGSAPSTIPTAVIESSVLETVERPEPVSVVVEESTPPEVTEQVVPAPEPAPAPRRRVTASDRFKIIGLIGNAKLALDENRLMSPANDNAYTRYLKVLELDPSDVRARQGMREIARRYLTLAQSASRDGDVERARTFLERAKRADPESPRIAEIEGLIGR